MNPFFQRIGLTENEEEIYLFLLAHGHSIASLVGKRLNIKRVTAYASLRSLVGKGLVTVFDKNNVKYFDAVPPKDILTLCERRIEAEKRLAREAELVLPDLEAIRSNGKKPVLEVRGEMKYYQGLEGVKELIDETLQEGEKEQLCFGLNRYHAGHLKDEWKTYTNKRVSREMRVRSIQPDTDVAKQYKERDASELRTTRLVPKEKFPAASELNIIGDMIALFVTHGDKPAGMKIYHTEMAKMLRSLFELAYEKAEEYDKDE